MIPMELPLVPMDRAERAKLRGIEQVERNNRDFVDAAFAIIESLSRLRTSITSLDVWALYDGPLPKHPRAIGAAFVRAHKARLIAPSNIWRKSGRASDHNQQIRVWVTVKP